MLVSCGQVTCFPSLPLPSPAPILEFCHVSQIAGWYHFTLLGRGQCAVKKYHSQNDPIFPTGLFKDYFKVYFHSFKEVKLELHDLKKKVKSLPELLSQEMDKTAKLTDQFGSKKMSNMEGIVYS